MGKTTIEYFVKEYGSIYGSSIVSFIFVIVLLFFDFSIGVWFLISLIGSYCITSIIRLVYYKPRPMSLEKKKNHLIERVVYSSFPSAHIQRAVLTTYFVYFLFKYFLIIGVILTIGVAVSRYIRKRHDWFDIAGGFILGVLYVVLFKTLIF